MSITNVHCEPNKYPINAIVTHFRDGPQRITIEANRALIDQNGVIRFFTFVYPDGEAHGYKLHPYKEHPLSKQIDWVIDFLSSYGLSRARGKIVKTPKDATLAAAEAVQIGSYFLFNRVGGHAVRSFNDKMFGSSNIGYHNIITDKLIFIGAIVVKK